MAWCFSLLLVNLKDDCFLAHCGVSVCGGVLLALSNIVIDFSFSLWRTCNQCGLLWEQVPFYLAELTEKTGGHDDRIDILKLSQAKLKVLVLPKFKFYLLNI